MIFRLIGRTDRNWISIFYKLLISRFIDFNNKVRWEERSNWWKYPANRERHWEEWRGVVFYVRNEKTLREKRWEREKIYVCLYPLASGPKRVSLVVLGEGGRGYKPIFSLACASIFYVYCSEIDNSCFMSIKL